MKEKVIFDTNFLIEKRMKNFFGKQNELNKFSKIASIVLPDIVIDELKARYKRDFFKEKESFVKKLLNNVANHNVEEINIDETIQKLIDAETLQYEVIKLTKPDYLFEIKDLAIKKEPPFSPQDGTDKGFKDAYIYFTVLEYLQNVEDKYLFVLTNDSLLKQAFEKHPNIVVIKDYSEFVQNSITQLYDDYFIDKLKEEFSNTSISAENITDYWININENKVLLLAIDDGKYAIEVDSGEIIGSVNKSKYNVNDLINSRSFETTHHTIEEFTPFINYFSDDEILKILNASFSNEQIKWIIKDDDVKEFISMLYKAKNELIENDVADFLKENFE